MARPQKQTVDYFPHDTDASTNSRTLKILENRFGNDGYTFWFKLLELLGRKEGHYIDFNDEDGLEYLSSETKIKDIETLKEMLEILVRRGSIDKELFEHKIIWCQSFVEGIADAYRNRKASLPQKPNLNNIRNSIPDSHNSISDNDNPQTKLNKTKVNNNKYTGLFNLWNSLGIYQHKKLTRDMRGAIDSARKDYSQEEIERAMSNYAIIVKGKEYYFDHRWTLAEFLSRRNSNNIERFLDLEIAKSNFKKEAGIGTHRESPRSIPKPEEYADPNRA